MKKSRKPLKIRKWYKMIDIHSHIIFDIDDGAKDIECSVALCRQAFNNGFDGIVATPHFTNYSRVDDFILERDFKLDAIRAELKKENIDLKLYSGAELYLTDDIFSANDLDCLAINNSRYILCEFSLGRFDVENGLLQLKELFHKGFVPILAHPERYYEVRKNPGLLDLFLWHNVLLQVNADSLAGNIDPLSQKIATDLLLNGDAKFIASDAHDTKMRNMDFIKKFSTVSSKITENDLIRCFVKNASAVINNSGNII